MEGVGEVEYQLNEEIVMGDLLSRYRHGLDSILLRI